MSTEVKKEIQLEIAHVLFIDIVGYSKLSVNDQHAAVERAERARSRHRAISKGRNGRPPVKNCDRRRHGAGLLQESGSACAMRGRNQPRAQEKSTPANSDGHPQRAGQRCGGRERADQLAGAGINMAQRVMDCGDAGHILLSQHVAEDLEEYEHWRPLLHDLGTCEVKHGVRVGVVNLYGDQLGNPQPPKKFQTLKKHRARIALGRLGNRTASARCDNSRVRDCFRGTDALDISYHRRKASPCCRWKI